MELLKMKTTIFVITNTLNRTDGRSDTEEEKLFHFAPGSRAFFPSISINVILYIKIYKY